MLVFVGLCYQFAQERRRADTFEGTAATIWPILIWRNAAKQIDVRETTTPRTVRLNTLHTQPFLFWNQLLFLENYIEYVCCPKN